MEPSELRRAVEAGRATASELGLQVDDVIVIQTRIASRCDWSLAMFWLGSHPWRIELAPSSR